MGKFILGIIVAVVAICVAFLIYTRMGFAPIAADQNAGSLEAFLLGGALDPSVEKHAPHTPFPLTVNDANLITGMKLYQMNCATCHGGVDKRPSAMGEALYPKAPQFIVRNRGLHDPGWFTFYQIQHGIRRTGMPAWDKLLSADDMWKLTMFLENVGNLPPAVQQEIQRSFPNAQPAQ